MSKSGAQLSNEEQEVLDNYYKWYEEQCLKRLPKKVYTPMHFISRAKRYEFFIIRNAPEIVINEEGRCLAEEMILYHYCTNESC
jgi:hypothetical protein